ncbi:hypothetical protein BDV59DRAFT_209669 [Aspergillus ambiguus]|uniref:plasma-membrane proton-efflux P-type ATPase n=1 Tax=Aspergillus ambiguus TaxID=176160 RepID=UPI003CCD0FC7
MECHHHQGPSASSEGKDSVDYHVHEKDEPIQADQSTASTQRQPQAIDDDEINALIESLRAEEENDPVESDGVNSQEPRSIPQEMLQTDEFIGLTPEEVVARRKKYGWNKLKEEKRNLFLQFLWYFVGPVQFVMEAAAVLAAGLQDWVDFGVICALLLLNATVGFIQEFQAGSIVNQLKRTLALKATVVRDCSDVSIQASDIVPGDIVMIEEGSIIPADGRVVDSRRLQVDQSSITGESLAVDKLQGDVCYASSVVKRGTATLIVTATGDYTFVGRSAALANAASNGTGHFTEVLNNISVVLLVLVIMTLLVVWVSSYYRSNDIVKILEFTLAVTIIGVPVGLPAVVTTTMAVGAAYLAKKGAIVQRLSAIESLAGVEILCTDKTGTLTMNKVRMFDKPWSVNGSDPVEIQLTACLAASRKTKAMDPIDRAFFWSLISHPTALASLAQYRILQYFPFDPVSKKTTAIVRTPDGEKITCVKGAPLIVLKTVGRDQFIPEPLEYAYKARVSEAARRGFRCIGVARKRSNGKWDLLGIAPCSDALRHDSMATIKEAKNLGLSIKMLTGDAVGIAKETLRQLGLGTNVYDAEGLGLGGTGTMPGSEVYDFVEGADGFAEVFPQHKYNVVEILQKRGYLVAMTGDGVNDAPSLKKADAGIAVSNSSDAARTAADIVFIGPGLSNIINALKTSRQIFHRMHAYVIYRIALSLHLEIFLGLWIAIMNENLNLQLVVFIAIFADIATLAIAYDNATYSKTPEKWNLPKLWGMSVILGGVLAIGTWVTLTTMIAGGEQGGIVEKFGKRDEVLFLEISLTQNWLIFITRSKGPFWSSKPSWQLVGAVLVVDILATIFCIFGWFVGGQTSIITVVRTWVFSIGVFCVMGGVYFLLDRSKSFDDLMHWRKRGRGRTTPRDLEDFIVTMQRTSKQHENSSMEKETSVLR